MTTVQISGRNAGLLSLLLTFDVMVEAWGNGMIEEDEWCHTIT
jgi:hypothetical protein